MATLPDRFSLEISPRNGGSHKSISQLLWEDIPRFSILTGRNGSGKTQLLEVLAYHFSGAVPYPYQNSRQLPVEVRVTGEQYGPADLTYVPSEGVSFGVPASSVGTLASFRNQFANYAQQTRNPQPDVISQIRSHRALRSIGSVPGSSMTEGDLRDMLPDHFEFALEEPDVLSGLGHLFIAYKVKYLDSLDRGAPGKGKGGEELGPSPWDVVNEALTTAGFQYVVTPPGSIIEHYEMRFKDRTTSREVAAADLSSGEKVLLQLVLWMFAADKAGQFAKLLLLDEPDAHLHPAMTQQFMDVISKVLVGRHGIRVIMTTHSPSTVALAPEGSVFRLDRGAAAVERVENRAEIISLLTAGLVTVSRATKYCFVEDEDDVPFYDAIRDILTDFGPSRDPRALAPAPSLVFMPASIGSGRGKTGGGCTVVTQMVDKFDAEPLDRSFFGIIDRDAGNTGTSRVFVLDRYSFENYLLDPLNLYALLVEEALAPTIAGLDIKPGDEHLLRGLASAQFQAIVDRITGDMEAADGSLRSGTRINVAYTTGQTVDVPSWVTDHRGHDLLPIAQATFATPKVINPPRLIKSLRRCRVIPVHLADMLASVQVA